MPTAWLPPVPNKFPSNPAVYSCFLYSVLEAVESSLQTPRYTAVFYSVLEAVECRLPGYPLSVTSSLRTPRYTAVFYSVLEAVESSLQTPRYTAVFYSVLEAVECRLPGYPLSLTSSLRTRGIQLFSIVCWRR